MDDVLNGLSDSLVGGAKGMKHRDGEAIPAVIAVQETPTNPDLGSISDGVAEAKVIFSSVAASPGLV